MRFTKQIMLIGLMMLSLALSAQVYLAPNQYLIEFTDKNNSPYSIENPEAFLSEKAIQRRAKQGIVITEQDIPVNQSYVNEVESLGVIVTNVSKWYNTAVIYVENSAVLDDVEALDCVKDFDEKLSHKAIPRKEKINKFKKFENIRSAKEGNNALYGDAFWQIELENGHVLHEYGFMGEGMDIAVIDAGFSFADKMETLATMFSEGRLLGTKDFVYPNATSFFGDVHFHGTAVLSHIAADSAGWMVGTAPKANYWLIRSENSESEYIVEEEYMISAFEFADSVGADLATASLGYFQFDDATMDHHYNDMDGNMRLAKAADIAFSKGMVVTLAAGNEAMSPWEHIVTPSDAHNVLAIGASDSDGNHAYFSSLGPAADGRVKPDVTGVGNGTIYQCEPGILYGMGMGTSYATPIIAGLTACLMQSNTDATNTEIIELVRQSASQYNSPDVELGYGIPDYKKAYLTLNPPIYSGDVTSDLIWRENAYVDGDITIKGDGKITILPGTNIRLDGAFGIKVQDNGSLIASGSLVDSIVFTTHDSIALWKGFLFENNSATESSVFEYCSFTKAFANADKLNGGAIKIIGTPDAYADNIQLANCVFESCLASSHGGALAIEYANVDVVNCVFRNNIATQQGGAIFAKNATLNLYGDLLYDNRAALGNVSIKDGELNVINSTIVNNVADSASAFFMNNSTLEFANAIVWGNMSADSLTNNQLVIENATATSSFKNSNIQHGNTFNANEYLQCLDILPDFESTPDRNFKLKTSSPCVNTGLNTVLDEINLVYDLNQTERIINDTVDMGAYEFGSKFMTISGELAYGRSVINSYNLKYLYLNNTGNSSITISSVEFPECYSSEWEGGVIAPGESQEVLVIFIPLEEKKYAGVIRFSSNIDSGTDTIEASGTGSHPYVKMFINFKDEPIVGAVFKMGDQTIETTSDGMVDLGYLPAEDYDYTLEADGFCKIWGAIFVSNYDMDINNAMMREGGVFFKVYVDSVGTDGALVSFNGDNVTTYANGFADFFDVPDGDFNYTVSLDGYETFKGKLTYQGGFKNVEVNLQKIVGVNDFEAEKLTCYPNPVKNVLTINNGSKTALKSVKVYNYSGALVSSVSLGGGTNCEIDLSTLNSGIYILRISDEKGKIYTQKITKN